MSQYRHRFLFDASSDLAEESLSKGKVVCIGRNYAAHAKELGNPLPKRPVLFIKNHHTMVNWQDTVAIPTNRGECHHELELAVLIQSPLKHCSQEEAANAIAAVTIALDLTLRDLQSELKEKAHPWEAAKSFEASCPIGAWTELPSVQWLKSANIELLVNQQVRQKSSTALMTWPVLELIQEVSRHFPLYPGDVVLTGTPAGVAALHCGDSIEAHLFDEQNQLIKIQSEVVALD